ncbi:GMP synthase (glutamine-hydrolyzing), partial [candidate division WOR-3 bacterium]
QFHPEVSHTRFGKQMLKNFLFQVAGLKRAWNLGRFIDEKIAEIKTMAKEGNVICGISGGVDSATAATIVSRAVGRRLHLIFVDNGLLRAGEVAEVKRFFHRGYNFHFVDARRIFLKRLKGVVDPEKKRKIIGRTFIEVFEKEAGRIRDVRYLVQGTLYPDVIESGHGIGPASVIKSHHNVGGLPEEMGLRLIEPLRLLFKDEVRRIAKRLGLPAAIVNRKPFPGPGLAVRIIGAVDENRLETLRRADAILIEEAKQFPIYRKLWQIFPVLLPVSSVGVMGDKRSYGETIVIRAVVSEDGMTADWARLPYDLLERVARRITNEIEGIVRVVFDLTSKPPATIEWE